MLCGYGQTGWRSWYRKLEKPGRDGQETWMSWGGLVLYTVSLFERPVNAIRPMLMPTLRVIRKPFADNRRVLGHIPACWEFDFGISIYPVCDPFRVELPTGDCVRLSTYRS